MIFRFRTHAIIYACALSLTLLCASRALAQTDEAFGDDASDPVKLFGRGQEAHARGDLKLALEFYEGAIKLRPEFPEAELQRGAALVALNRLPEAEKAYRRAIELRKDWALPYTALATLLITVNRESEAESLLRRALELDVKSYVTLDALARLRLRAGDTREALALARRATDDKEATASAWVVRGVAEHAAGDKAAAAASLDRALQMQPDNLPALEERADLRAEAGDYEHAINDLQAVLRVRPSDKDISLTLARFYDQAGRADEARRVRQTLGLSETAGAPAEGATSVIGTPDEIEAANSDDPVKARVALEKLLARNPRNAALLARLGASYRTTDPQRSLDYYRRAAEIEPRNAAYATGYAAALVQARRFIEAAMILRRIIAAAPDTYAAHANLATALYESKQFSEAIHEYGWLLKAKPDLTVAYFFIATAHDFLGEYPEALAAYETFLVRADAQKNQLEIEKIHLRLPSLRNQIKRGEGAKRKKQKT